MDKQDIEDKRFAAMILKSSCDNDLIEAIDVLYRCQVSESGTASHDDLVIVIKRLMSLLRSLSQFSDAFDELAVLAQDLLDGNNNEFLEM